MIEEFMTIELRYILRKKHADIFYPSGNRKLNHTIIIIKQIELTIVSKSYNLAADQP